MFLRIEVSLEIKNFIISDLSQTLDPIVEHYELGQWPAEIGPRAQLQAVVLIMFFEHEMQLFDQITTTNKKVENVQTFKNKHLSDEDIEKIANEIGDIKCTSKKMPKKSARKKLPTRNQELSEPSLTKPPSPRNLRLKIRV